MWNTVHTTIVVITGSIIAIIVTAAIVAGGEKKSPPDPGCQGHGGVLKITQAKDTNDDVITFFTCSDGHIVARRPY